MAVSKLFNSGNYKIQRLLFRNSHIQKIKMYASWLSNIDTRVKNKIPWVNIFVFPFE